jgi:citrate lyase subunit beta/citryl-CoA lyase
LGYVAKSAVDPAHAAAINWHFTPDDGELRPAQRIVEAFEAARARGEARVELDGSLVEMPTYSNAKRLIARWEALREFQHAPG